MGFLSGLFGGGGDSPSITPLKSPDFGKYWKEYSGWIANINNQTKTEISNVRARLSAAGATPELMKSQVESLESQRINKIGEFQAGPTYRFLKEGFDIASGKVPNPYLTDMPGTAAATPIPGYGLYGGFFSRGGEGTEGEDSQAALEANVKAIQAAGISDPTDMQNALVSGMKPASYTQLHNLEEYYAQYFEPGSVTPDTPDAAAKKRATVAASGAVPGPGGESATHQGGGAADTSNPWLSKDETLWR